MSSNKKTSVSPSTTSQIREVVAHFLQECDIAYSRDIRFDDSFRDACYAEATRRGLDLVLLERPLDVGIALADTAFRHLESQPLRIVIALWSAFATYIDDAHKNHAEGLDEFFSRFFRQEPQRHQVLDQIATLLREVPDHWGVISSNLITTSEMDFLTSTIIDRTIEGMDVQSSMAPDFPQFSRRMTGIAQAYSIMVFPPELDSKIWIHVTPDLIHYINGVNDLLSFFKEELDGETLNFVSMTASSSNTTKIEVLRDLAEALAQSYGRASRLLQSNPAAWEAFRDFCVGYVGFHVLSVRYRLDQLDL